MRGVLLMFKKGLTGFTASTLLLACTPTSVLEAKIFWKTDNTLLKEGSEALCKEAKLQLEGNNGFFAKYVSVSKVVYCLLAMYFVGLVEKLVALRLIRNKLGTKYRNLRSKLDVLGSEERESRVKKNELDSATSAQKSRLQSKDYNEKQLSDILERVKKNTEFDAFVADKLKERLFFNGRGNLAVKFGQKALLDENKAKENDLYGVVEMYTKKLKECRDIIEKASNNESLVHVLTIRGKKKELEELSRKIKHGYDSYWSFEKLREHLQFLLNQFNGNGILEHRRYLISKSIFDLTDVEVNDAVNALINKKEEYSRESSKHYYDEEDLSSLKDFKERFEKCKKALELAKEIEGLEKNGRYLNKLDEAEISGTLSKVVEAGETIKDLTSSRNEFDFMSFKLDPLFGCEFNFTIEHLKKLTPLVKIADDEIRRVEKIKSDIAELSSTIDKENEILETLENKIQSMEEQVTQQREDLESDKEYKDYNNLLKKQNELKNNLFKFTYPGQYTIFS